MQRKEIFIAFDLLLQGERVVSAYRQSQGDIVLRRVNTGRVLEEMQHRSVWAVAAPCASEYSVSILLPLTFMCTYTQAKISTCKHVLFAVS